MVQPPYVRPIDYSHVAEKYARIGGMVQQGAQMVGNLFMQYSQIKDANMKKEALYKDFEGVYGQDPAYKNLFKINPDTGKTMAYEKLMAMDVNEAEGTVANFGRAAEWMKSVKSNPQFAELYKEGANFGNTKPQLNKMFNSTDFIFTETQRLSGALAKIEGLNVANALNAVQEIGTDRWTQMYQNARMTPPAIQSREDLAKLLSEDARITPYISNEKVKAAIDLKLEQFVKTKAPTVMEYKIPPKGPSHVYYHTDQKPTGPGGGPQVGPAKAKFSAQEITPAFAGRYVQGVTGLIKKAQMKQLDQGDQAIMQALGISGPTTYDDAGFKEFEKRLKGDPMVKYYEDVYKEFNKKWAALDPNQRTDANQVTLWRNARAEMYMKHFPETGAPAPMEGIPSFGVGPEPPGTYIMRPEFQEYNPYQAAPAEATGVPAFPTIPAPAGTTGVGPLGLNLPPQ